jgi:hypothetical protein
VPWLQQALSRGGKATADLKTAIEQKFTVIKKATSRQSEGGSTLVALPHDLRHW